MIGALQGRTFAPRDVRIAEFAPKDNVHGIGYQPLSARVGIAMWRFRRADVRGRSTTWETTDTSFQPGLAWECWRRMTATMKTAK